MPEMILVFVMGLIIGSFLNVVCWRLPEGRSIVRPGSSCPQCGQRLRVPDLVPVVSFLAYRGHCRYCGDKISLQYPLVELITGILLMVLYWQYGPAMEFFLYGLLTCLLIVCSVIDLKEMIIPNKITYPGIISGLFLTMITGHLSWLQALLGVLIPGGMLLLIALVYKEGLGLGDVKLIAMIGAFTGWHYALPGLFLGALVGSLLGLGFILVGKMDRKTRIPFGPLISLGAVLMMIFGEGWLEFYLGLF